MGVFVEFLSFPRDTNWVNGLVNDGEYFFEAKLFDDSSQFGIEKGRVSKLSISVGDEWTGFNNCICNYDRGWDIEPTSDQDLDVFDAVMDFLESSPKRF